MYSRPDNPTYTRAESVLASLEGGADAALFSSGMAAVSAVASAVLLGAGLSARAVPKNCYFAVRVFSRSGAASTAWTACCTTARSKATSKTRCAAWIARTTPPATASASCCGSRRRPTPPGVADIRARRPSRASGAVA